MKFEKLRFHSGERARGGGGEHGRRRSAAFHGGLSCFQVLIFQSKFFDNPMHQSGLVLAGANITLMRWSRGQEAVSVDDDGILMAEDVSTLDMKGTWLVTLSACKTGQGKAQTGEGVMGLRRGFVQAGAQNLLMTLWPISDETTVQPQVLGGWMISRHSSSCSRWPASTVHAGKPAIVTTTFCL